MNKTYKATGINLKGIPFKEQDRLLTILTSEYGIIRAIAPGARKYKSSLRGRSELFVVNELLLVKGRSIDKIIQAETQEHYSQISTSLGKLTASQYLAEIVLNLALSQLPEGELFNLLNEHLNRIEKLSKSSNLLPYLSQAVFHLLAIAGIAPQVHHCCLSQKSLIPNFNDACWRVGFSFNNGGFINLDLSQLKSNKIVIQDSIYAIHSKLNAVELTLFQQLSQKTLPDYSKILPQQFNFLDLDKAWIIVERTLKDYVEFQLGRNLRSAAMIHDVLVPV
jgi:DNA repair protein RecO (recombination protein O)